MMLVARTKPYTAKEAADALGVSPHTIRAWIAQRRLACLRLGRSVRIPVSEIERVLTGSLVPAKSRISL